MALKLDCAVFFASAARDSTFLNGDVFEDIAGKRSRLQLVRSTFDAAMTSLISISPDSTVDHQILHQDLTQSSLKRTHQ